MECWRLRAGYGVGGARGLKDLAPPARKGFGSRLITPAAEYDLEGEATQIWRPEDLHYALTIPLVKSLASAEAARTCARAAHN